MSKFWPGITLIAFTLVVLFGEGCKPQKNAIAFAGDWYACSDDGYYVEMIIRKKTFKYSTISRANSDWFEFKINEDTLIQTDPFTYGDSVRTVLSKISYPEKDEMHLDFITSDEHWEFHRLKENIPYPGNDSEVFEGTKRRAGEYMR